MKKLLAASAFLLMICFSFKAKSQIGLSLNHIIPKGNYANVFKPTVGFEISYKATEQDNQFRYGGSIGFFKLNARQDTFPSYGLKGTANDIVLYPGYETFNNYVSIPIGINFDYQFLDSKFSPLIGLDFYAHFFSYDYTSYVAEIEQITAEESKFSIGFLPRIGLSYDYSELLTFDAGVGRSNSIEKGYAPQAYWKIYLLTTFYF